MQIRQKRWNKGTGQYNREKMLRDLSYLVAAAALTVAVHAQTTPKPAAPHPAGAPAAAQKPPLPPGKYVTIYTSMGNITCRLFDKEAPKTVENFRGLATATKPWTDGNTGKTRRSLFYNGLTFHRVIKNFMIQGGDPLGNGTGGPGFSIDDEISPNQHFDKPGLLAMANSGPNTNGSQFFITTAATPWLDGHYSLFGEVVEGQDVVDRISEVPVNENSKPLTPVKILRMTFRTVGAAPAVRRPAAHPSTGTHPRSPAHPATPGHAAAPATPTK